MADERKTPKYDASSIEVLDGLDAVRVRPGMYIGSTNAYGLHHLVWEIVDNAVDEALNGHGKHIEIRIHKDNSISVRDEGRGVPVDKVKKTGVSALETVFTTLHAGGKFGSEGGYKASGGLHGVGASVVNALSEFLDVEVYRGGIAYHMRFERGGRKVVDLEELGRTTKKGTLVHFKPDRTIFNSIEFKYDTIHDRLQESAFLLKGVTFKLDDERSGASNTFCYQNGLQEYIEVSTKNKTALGPIVYLEDTVAEIRMEVAFRYSIEDYNETIYSYANNVRTPSGGTHETGFRAGLTRAVNDFGTVNNLIKRNVSLEGSDIREGITAVISLRIPENKIQFEGQTKDKLGTPEANNLMQNFIYTKFTYFLNENIEFATSLIKKCVDSSNARLAARQAKLEARTSQKKKKEEVILSDKLTPAVSKEYLKNELFIVEGDSAGGTAKKGRDRMHQAILPLRGKPLNVSGTSLEKAMNNDVIATIVNTIGAGVGQSFDISDIHYGKIIIMTDADTDGAHIQTLLLNFFYKYMRPLINNGNVYMAVAPLYRVFKEVNKKIIQAYAWNDADLAEAKRRIGANCHVSRFKGLGEMDASQLKETTMDRATRRLIRVEIDDTFLADKRVEVLMGPDVPPRRKWIEENVEFDVADPYLEEQESGDHEEEIG